MAWIPGLTRGPAKRPEQGQKPAKETARPTPNRVQIERQRQAAAEAASDAERAERERDLGRLLAEGAVAPSADDGETVAAAAACHAQDKDLARRWMERLAAESSFAEVAMHGRFAELRFAAAQRVTSTALLEQVLAATRERDKRVHRHCSEILRGRRTQADREQRAGALLAELDAALADPPPLAAARLAQLDRAAQALGECAEAAQCAERLQSLHARARAEAERLRDLHRLGDRADALAREASVDTWPVADRLGGWQAELASVKEALAGLPDCTRRVATARVLDDALTSIEARLGDLARDIELHAACERALSGSDPAFEAAAWEAMDKPRNAAAREMLQALWARRAGAAKPAPPVTRAGDEPKRKPKPVLDIEAVRTALAALEQALAEGHLADADSALAQIEPLTAAGRLPGGLDGRLKRARGELGRLRGWARWGNVQAHDQLIVEAERLLAEPVEVEALAEAISRLRAEWKRLDASGPGSRAQWERFDALVERAYRPVAEQRARQAAEQGEARAARAALLDAWETWLGAIDWSGADWRAIERQRAEMLAKWRAGKRASFRDERALRKRFDPLIAKIDAQLAQAREAETGRRQNLIEQAEALREAPDLGGAIARARTLQAEWRDAASGVHLGRGREDAQWKRFRAACDAVFARREAERSERAAQAQQVEEDRKGLLASLESALSASSIGEIEAAVKRFQGAWRASPRAPREAAGGLEAQAARLTRRAAERIAELRRERRAGRYALLAQKSALAQRVETVAASGGVPDELLAQAREAWRALPMLDGEAERALKARLDAACAASPDSLANGFRLRAELLLDLELALDLQSPPAHAEARRMRQLARLKRRFSAESSDANPEQTVVRWYALAAHEDAEQDARMAVVVHALSTDRS
jgi:hypothetical protein